ncbi:hypothetical protein [[Acholeplasma] multilocale]|uniref:hypothetical protein n=1 Tax=[Acholeplasma] multilocale TaxID=264638 RepID=UPI000478DB1C|nr:hypothetical protein [[Acholeplasma] multilocale]
MQNRNKARVFGKLFKAQLLNYFTDPTNIVLNFVITSVTMLGWVALKPVGTDGFSSDPFVLASAIAISSIRNSQHTLTTIMSDWRDKRFFKKISATPVSNYLTYSCIFVFNWFINILMFAVLFGLGMIFESQRAVLYKVDILPFIIGFILNVVLSNVMALVIVQIFKNSQFAAIVTMLSYFLPMYLLGLGIPWNVVGQIKELNIVMYLFPHRYPLNLIQASWSGVSSSMEFPGVSPDTWLGQQGFGYGGNGWWLPSVISIVWIFGFSFLFIWLVKRSRSYKSRLRKYNNAKNFNQRIENIRSIKYVSSKSELEEQMKIIKSQNRRVKKPKRKTNSKGGDQNV